MLQRTVVGWDGSAPSGAALEWALRRGELTGHAVEVFDVVDRALFEGDVGALERAATQEEERLASLVEDVARTRPDGVSASALLVGDPLALLTEQTRADTLVVVGTAQRVGPRVRYGWSLGARLATVADGPVAVVPVEAANAARRRNGVVVGVDGSEVAMRALAFAAREASAAQERLTVVHCWQEPLAEEPLIQPDDEFVDAQQVAHLELLEDQVGTVTEQYPDLQVVSVLLRSNPVTGLRGQSEDARMLVVGSRRLTGWRRTWLGSVSHGVVLDLVAPTVVVGPESDPLI